MFPFIYFGKPLKGTRLKRVGCVHNNCSFISPWQHIQLQTEQTLIQTHTRYLPTKSFLEKFANYRKRFHHKMKWYMWYFFVFVSLSKQQQRKRIIFIFYTRFTFQDQHSLGKEKWLYIRESVCRWRMFVQMKRTYVGFLLKQATKPQAIQKNKIVLRKMENGCTKNTQGRNTKTLNLNKWNTRTKGIY